MLIPVICHSQSLIGGITDSIINKVLLTEELQFFSRVYYRAGEGGTPETSKNEYYENGDIPFIKIEDLKNKYIEHNNDYITDLGLKKSSAWIIPENSIIYSNGATIGAISINKYPISTKQGILGIIIKNGISVEYMYYLMKSTYFKQQVHRIITYGTMPTAYLKDLNNIKIPLPIISQQSNIGKILGLISEKIAVEQSILYKIQRQKESILMQMFK